MPWASSPQPEPACKEGTGGLGTGLNAQTTVCQALCDRLQSLVSAAKDLAKPSSAPELPKTTNSTDLLPPATLPSAPVLGKGEQQSRASGVTVRAQQRAQLVATEESTQRALGGAAKVCP